VSLSPLSSNPNPEDECSMKDDDGKVNYKILQVENLTCREEI
jgi:hypothetical protein